MSLISQYIFNNNANDSVGSYNGSATAMSYTDLPSNLYLPGKAAVFNGSTSYITFGNQLGSNYDNYTIEFWFKVPSVTSDYQMFYSRSSAADKDSVVGQQSLYPVGYYFVDDFEPTGGGTAVLNNCATNTWYYVASVRDGNKIRRVYINGKLAINSTNTEVPAPTSAVSFSVMGQDLRDESCGRWFAGQLANFRIYDEVLSPSIIANNYALESGSAINYLKQYRRTRNSGPINGVSQ